MVLFFCDFIFLLIFFESLFGVSVSDSTHSQFIDLNSDQEFTELDTEDVISLNGVTKDQMTTQEVVLRTEATTERGNGAQSESSDNIKVSTEVKKNRNSSQKTLKNKSKKKKNPNDNNTKIPETLIENKTTEEEVMTTTEDLRFEKRFQ